MPDTPPPADLTGRTLGEFELLRRIGAGGMGQVYLAQQLSLKRRVALKLLRNDLADNPTALKRFQAEAEAVATLNHPNIVQVYGAGEDGGLRYMALEYVDGRNLREHLARRFPLDLPVALSIIRQVALALQTAHERGIVHRDIKPENILVTKKVVVKVTDFGLSRFFTGSEAVNLTQSGITLGTPLYLSPEQARGAAVDHRSDLYSFGVTCYHLLAGEPPFQGATAIDVALKHVTDRERPLAGLRPDLPADLCALVHKLMAKDPTARPQSARDVLRDLAKIRDGLTLGTTQAAAPLALSAPSALALTPSGGVPVAPVRWRRWALAGLACVAAALAGVFAYLRLHPLPEPVPASNPPPAAPGLPDIRPPEKLTTPRERELLAVLKDRGTKPEAWTAAGVELGLLYVREGRADEAQARFEALEKEKLDGHPVASAAAHAAGKLGRAVVLAHRDNDPKHPQAAQESLRVFADALVAPGGKLAGKGGDRLAPAAHMALLRYPELAQAVAEALNRDAANAGQAKLTPAVLEALRTPRGLTRKE